MKAVVVAGGLLLFAWGADADAQELAVEWAVTARGLLSVQPSGEELYGPPYLDRSLAGVGPGVAVGVERAAGRFAVVAEFSTAAVHVDLVGRSVPVPDGLRGTGRLRDHLFSVLAGWAADAARDRIAVLGGLSVVAGPPAVDGTRLEASTGDDQAPIAPTAGVDIVRRFDGPFDLLVTARYSYLRRSDRAKDLEVGPHLIRFGVGVRMPLGGR